MLLDLGFGVQEWSLPLRRQSHTLHLEAVSAETGAEHDHCYYYCYSYFYRYYCCEL